MKNIYIILIVILALQSYSQDKICGTAEMHNYLLSTNLHYKENYDKAQEIMYDVAAHPSHRNNLNTNTVYYIPIVVHVIHTGDPIGTGSNPSDAQIQNYINLLNQAFSATYPGYPTTSNGGVDIGIQFVLAQRTPDCTATNGINRINASSNSNYVANGVAYDDPGISHSELASMIFWDNRDYINLWLVNEINDIYAGYAFYPNYGYSFGDGVVIESNNVYSGIPRVIAHEFGHIFDLMHTFEGSNGSSCAENDYCQYDGDKICDTDPIVEDISCSPNSINVCTNLPLGTNAINYMSYSSCQKLFTQGQKERMLNALQNLRPTLITSLGGSPPSLVTPSISITTQNTTICPAQVVTLSSNISHGGYTPHYQWYVNNVAVSQSSSYTYYPSNNDVVYCKLTSDFICAYPNEVNSNPIIFTVTDFIQPSASLSTSSTNLCTDTQITVTLAGVGFSNATYEWYRTGVPPTTSATPIYQFTPNNNDTLYCMVTINDTGCLAGTNIYAPLLAFTVSPQPAQPLIIETANYLMTTNYFNGQGQWYMYVEGVGVPIAGATDRRYYPTTSGIYYFLVNNNGCSNQSEDINFTSLSIEDIDNDANFSIYPNPTNDRINIESKYNELTAIKLFDIQGRAILIEKVSGYRHTIYLEDLPKSMYFMLIETINGKTIHKVIKK